MFAITHSALELGLQEKHLAYVRTTLRENAHALCDALRKHLPDYLRFRQPDGGYFVWVQCPAHWDTEALWAIARNEHKTQFQPGVKFSATKQMRNCIRLSVSYYDKEELEEGARRLGAAVRDYEKVFNLFAWIFFILSNYCSRWWVPRVRLVLLQLPPVVYHQYVWQCTAPQESWAHLLSLCSKKTTKVWNIMILLILIN
jgi:hypothetical protein